MGAEPPASGGRIGTLFSVLERVVLFALSLAVGLLNLLIGLAIAAHMGVIPKTAAVRVLHVTTQATDFVTHLMAAPRGAAPAPKRKPKP